MINFNPTRIGAGVGTLLKLLLNPPSNSRGPPLITCISLYMSFNLYLYFIRYRPGSIPVVYVQKQLGYFSKDQEEWDGFVEPFSLFFADAEKTKIDCKASAASIPLIK